MDTFQFESPGLTRGIRQLRQKDSKASTGLNWGPWQWVWIAQQGHLAEGQKKNYLVSTSENVF